MTRAARYGAILAPLLVVASTGCASGITSRSITPDAQRSAASSSILTLHYTTPAASAAGQSCHGSDPEPGPLTARIYWLQRHPRWADWPTRWREDMPVPLVIATRSNLAPGTPDSLTIASPGEGALWITMLDAAGNESCPSNLISSTPKVVTP